MESGTPETSSPRSLLIATTRAELRVGLAKARKAGKRVGLVPTMGALHEGHLSLMEAAHRECDFVVATIFVNPTQFAPNEDLSRYPRTFDSDLRGLTRVGVDLVFVPRESEMYSPEHVTFVEQGGVALPWEGAARPGHFRGVLTIVLKLLQLTIPDVAYFGQKDYQQSAVIRRMVQDFDIATVIRVLPIVRDADGLAMSSRNVYLSPSERASALALSQAMFHARDLVARGESDARKVAAEARALLEAAPGVRLEYITIVDADTLVELESIERGAVALVAARVGATRLIDNSLLILPASRPADAAG